jgi:hypothetical protein
MVILLTNSCSASTAAVGPDWSLGHSLHAPKNNLLGNYLLSQALVHGQEHHTVQDEHETVAY